MLYTYNAFEFDDNELDRIDAGRGNDVVEARDGVRERVDCGPGRHRANVDRQDRVVGCERVTRRYPRAPDP